MGIDNAPRSWLPQKLGTMARITAGRVSHQLIGRHTNCGRVRRLSSSAFITASQTALAIESPWGQG